MSVKKVDGFVMKGCLKLSGVKHSDILPLEAIRVEDHNVGALMLKHQRTQVMKEAQMTFFMNVKHVPCSQALQTIRQLGHQPAVLSEVESLRSFPRNELQCLFAMADEHARKRSLKRPYVDSLCLPVLGSRVFAGKKEHIPVLLLNRVCGYYVYDLFHLEEMEHVHPAWMIPIVQLS